MSSIGVRGTDVEWLNEIRHSLVHTNGDEEFRLTYSINFVGEQKYTLENFTNSIERVIWKYIVSEAEEETKDSCRHCGYGYQIWYLLKLKDGNYAFVDLWNGCLSYDANGTIEFSNSIEDVTTMCMTTAQYGEYCKYCPNNISATCVTCGMETDMDGLHIIESEFLFPDELSPEGAKTFIDILDDYYNPKCAFIKVTERKISEIQDCIKLIEHIIQDDVKWSSFNADISRLGIKESTLDNIRLSDLTMKNLTILKNSVKVHQADLALVKQLIPLA